jgi:glycosyltransferase involved in cell wall biosynthesis
MNWSAGRRLEYAGESWGQKDTEFRRVLDLPGRVSRTRLAAVVNQTGGAPFPADAISRCGWNILDPHASAGDWRAYREFIGRSAGEFSVAKETYVKARTGWFSCRSACYLAAGRPVVTQDTGWSDNYPTGDGLFPFDDVESAADAIDRIVAEPVRHGRAARRIAEEFFDARRILARMLREAGAQ